MIRTVFALLLVFAGLAAADLPPHQASLVSGEKTFPKVYVFSETMDGITFALDTPDNPQTQLGHGKYGKVTYADPNDVPWLRGRNLMGERKYAEAAAQYQQGTASRESWYTRYDCFLQAAECFLQADKPADTVKTLDAMLAAFPKAIDQARIAYLRGQAQARLGDAAAALKTYADLAKHADWGPDAAALGALGQAGLLVAEKKHAEAAAVLLPVFAKLDPAADVRFAQVGAQLAEEQLQAGQAEPGIATLRRLAYGAPDADARAKAHIAWARQLLAAGDAKSLFSAFDHAAIATGLRQADTDTQNQAAKLAGQIVARIDKLASDQCSNDVKAEYRRYLQR